MKEENVQEKNPMQKLAERFPYMFEEARYVGTHTGWFPIFEKLCEDIDAFLGDEKMGFRWLQCKEKFGAARFYCYMDTKEPTGSYDEVNKVIIEPTLEEEAEHERLELRRQEVQQLVNRAADKTAKMCIVCGEPGSVDESHSYMLTLCEHHKRTRDVWCEKEGYWIDLHPMD